jgi:hypothetical protein
VLLNLRVREEPAAGVIEVDVAGCIETRVLRRAKFVEDVRRGVVRMCFEKACEMVAHASMMTEIGSGGVVQRCRQDALSARSSLSCAVFHAV